MKTGAALNPAPVPSGWAGTVQSRSLDVHIVCAVGSISSTEQGGGVGSSDCAGNNKALNCCVNQAIHGTRFALREGTYGPAGII